MIKINLLEQKKPFKMPVVLGIDLGDLNWKALIAVGILSYIPDFFVYPSWEEEMKNLQSQITVLQNNSRKLQRDLKKNSGVKERLAAFNKQVEKLQKRSVQVDLILKEKRNPNQIMEKIARKLPSDMWFSTFLIDEDKSITIKGGGIHYKSIGDFLSSVNSAGFFDQPLSLTESKTVEEGRNGEYRVQIFTIKGRIDKFDPWAQ
ncbi:putative pilus assembly protein [Halobacteriovorax marinus SJ]|uniref:Pilus assembly protein n=1 Tax=Halobacteriovorax marinus (strain ATCC BAA-682 / DSM 15412 / SJ) TaxID=862908 RepID=E1X2B0_HALMS|nr:PilN domain-containing protein [Halobacteriovorax marinus]CBW25066.1 putative pilus assembly protein [Halobacteriovorax marinus SJ]